MTGNEKTLSGILEIGVEYEGKVHRDFTLRLPTVGDEIDVGGSDVPDAGFRVALMAASLVSLGTIPKGAITYELLCEELCGEDFGLILKAHEDLKKKRKALNESTATSPMPASGSESTGIATKTSALLVL